jgi:sigma-E factor negative regulatory protein RseA
VSKIRAAFNSSAADSAFGLERLFMNQIHTPLDNEALSAWVDGELPPEESTALCERWDTDTQVRASWHRYHWLGDALRSQDLAKLGVAHDTAFLHEWRLKRDAEAQPSNVTQIRADQAAATPQITPHPTGKTPQPQKSSFWGMAWAAAAAGVMVSGAFWVTQRGAPSDAAPTMVDASPAVMRKLPKATSTASPQMAALAQVRSAADAPSSQMIIRDPKLDAYLFAHDPFTRSGPNAALSSSIARVQAASAGQ